jgi:hypothetical protein
MATDVEFFNQYFGDSDSEAEFLGFDAVELDEIDHRNVVPEFEIPNLGPKNCLISFADVSYHKFIRAFGFTFSRFLRCICE